MFTNSRQNRQDAASGEFRIDRMKLTKFWYVLVCGDPPTIIRATLRENTAPYFRNVQVVYQCNNDLVITNGMKTFSYVCALQGDGSLDWESVDNPAPECNRKFDYVQIK